MATSNTTDFFLWTNDGVQLLLQVTQEHKAAMATEMLTKRRPRASMATYSTGTVNSSRRLR